MAKRKKRVVSRASKLSPEQKTVMNLIQKLANPKPYDTARAKAFADESLRRHRETLKQAESPQA